MGAYRCGHQDLVQLFGGIGLDVRDNVFGVYWKGAAQLYVTNRMRHIRIVNNLFLGTDPRAAALRGARGDGDRQRRRRSTSRATCASSTTRC